MSPGSGRKLSDDSMSPSRHLGKTVKDEYEENEVTRTSSLGHPFPDGDY